MNYYLKAVCFALCTSVCASLFAQQTTYEKVYQLLQSSCAFSGCHKGSPGAGMLNLSGSMQQVYEQLVGVAPTNPAAKDKGYQRITPGYPERSYVLHKLAHTGWDAAFGVSQPEGSRMPPSPFPALEPAEIELMRQWVLYGARMDEKEVNDSLLTAYYAGQGKKRISIPPAPQEGEGFQIHYGPFFLPPNGEMEVFKKQTLELEEEVEINRIEVFFNDESHHFIIYKMRASAQGNYREGLRDVSESETAMFDNRILAAWQRPNNIELPTGTAYFWKTGNVMDLNYHFINFNSDSILAGDVYINVYVQPKGTAEQEMHSQLIPIDALELLLGGGELGKNLIIPNNGAPVVFTDEFALPFPNVTWHVWLLSTHTHRTGIDYDIYLRNPDGSKGDQLFEGFYNFDYTFNQGYYDWEHPPIRYFNPLLPVNMSLPQGGLIHEATYLNTTDDTLYWGNSALDEMMLFFIQYTEAPLSTHIGTKAEDAWLLTLTPNPARNESIIRYRLPVAAPVSLQLHDVQGRIVFQQHLGMIAEGEQQYRLPTASLAKGLYILRMQMGQQLRSRKLMVVD